MTTRRHGVGKTVGDEGRRDSPHMALFSGLPGFAKTWGLGSEATLIPSG